MYNLFTCEGFSGSFLACGMGWFPIVIIILSIFIIRKQAEDGNIPIAWNTIGAFVLGLGLWFLVISLTGDPRWGMLAGIVGELAGGFLLGMVMGE